MNVINEFSTVFNINYTIYLIEDISNLFFYFILSLNYNCEEEGIIYICNIFIYIYIYNISSAADIPVTYQFCSK